VNTGPAKPGPIDDRDVAEWKDRVNECCKKPGDVINSKSGPDARPWHAGLFDCFNPIDTCFMSWCLPCVVFGKTHHRLRKNGSLEGWEPVNTSVSGHHLPYIPYIPYIILYRITLSFLPAV
jgi:hypothetical protein